MASEVFLAVFHARFDACYDTSNKSCLRWWINESIQDFIAPTFICGDLLQACTVRHNGHCPKVLLWIMEEFFYISHDLMEQDHDGHVVLSYELMMEAEHWFRLKQGGGIGCHRPSSSSCNAPPCSQETLECIAWSKPDSKTLEHLVWSVYDGLLSPGPTPKLTGPKSYKQVTRCLATKISRGLQVRCLARTSAQFDKPTPVRVQLVVFAPPPERDREKDRSHGHGLPNGGRCQGGSCGRRGRCRPSQASNGLDAQLSMMLWWWNDQLLAVTVPTHGWGRNRDMAPCAPLAINVAMVLHHTPHVLPSCPNQHGDRAMAASGSRGPRGKQGRSVDRGLCLLLTMHGRSISWTVLGNRGWRNGPQVSPLAQAFPSAMGRHVSPSILQECWPSKHDIVPRQPMNEVWACITHCLHQVATRSPSNIAWDIFAWPDSNKNAWKEDCLPYSPGSMVDLSSRMPGIWLVLHDEAGKYQGVARVLKFEGHMLVYDPQTNGAGRVAMRGVPSSLTEVELWSTSDLGNFYPIPSTVPAGPKATQSPPEYEQTETLSPKPQRET